MKEINKILERASLFSGLSYKNTSFYREIEAGMSRFTNTDDAHLSGAQLNLLIEIAKRYYVNPESSHYAHSLLKSLVTSIKGISSNAEVLSGDKVTALNREDIFVSQSLHVFHRDDLLPLSSFFKNFYTGKLFSQVELSYIIQLSPSDFMAKLCRPELTAMGINACKNLIGIGTSLQRLYGPRGAEEASAHYPSLLRYLQELTACQLDGFSGFVISGKRGEKEVSAVSLEELIASIQGGDVCYHKLAEQITGFCQDLLGGNSYVTEIGPFYSNLRENLLNMAQCLVAASSQEASGRAARDEVQSSLSTASRGSVADEAQNVSSPPSIGDFDDEARGSTSTFSTDTFDDEARGSISTPSADLIAGERRFSVSLAWLNATDSRPSSTSHPGDQQSLSTRDEPVFFDEELPATASAQKPRPITRRVSQRDDELSINGFG